MRRTLSRGFEHLRARLVACFHAVAGKHVLAEACLRPGGEGMAPTIYVLRTILPAGFEQQVLLLEFLVRRAVGAGVGEDCSSAWRGF